MIVLYVGVIVNGSNNRNNHINNNNNRNKDDTTNVTKGVARKSILMQIAKAKLANGSH
jgi:hypothetical protein